MPVSTVDTARGPARLFIDHPARRPRAAVLLGHGAGGGVEAAVLVAVRDTLAEAGFVVGRFEQPYRVAGRRAPDRPGALDAAAVRVAAAFLEAVPAASGLVLGGKSMGARVACRIASDVGAIGVVALGFPLRPPGRPERSRAAELLGVACPVLVVQGERDTFGSPGEVRAIVPQRSGIEVHTVRGGDHSFAARRADGRTTGECVAEAAAVTAAWAERLAAGQEAT